MKKPNIARGAVVLTCAGALAFACTGLVACGGGGSASYKDGTYTAQSEIWEDEDEGNGNGYGVVTLTIKDGKISESEFKTYEPDGTLKDKDYGKGNSSDVLNQDFYNKAQRAVAASKEYGEKLAEVGNPGAVDCISGATISWNEFQEAANAALDQASQ